MNRDDRKLNIAQEELSEQDKKPQSFQIVEAYKALRTNLLFALAATEKKTAVISSPEPGVGKSTTAANLSIVMAQTNFKVLLIDADMRKPSLDRIFAVGRNEGLSTVLSGMTSFERAMIPSVAPNLDLLTAGPIPPNPQELLASSAMTKLLDGLQKRYDYILIDTPPVNVVADALMLTNSTAGIMLVARERKTHVEDLKKAEDAVNQVGGNLLGMTLTDVQEQRGGTRSRYYKKYQYVYGEK